MFFVLSKILVNLIYPISWITLALILSFLLKKPAAKRRSLVTALSLLLLFSNPFLLNIFANWWDIDTKAANKSYSCAIVLGGFVSEDADDGTGYFNNAADRFIQAIALKRSNQASHLLFSGGNADLTHGKFREADWIAEQMRLFNVPDSSVLIERNSRNTLENVKYSKQLLLSKGLKPPYLLVTSAFHMRRSLQTFKRQGLEVEPHACNYIAGHEETTLYSFIPSAGTLANWNFYVKEVVGFLVYHFKA